MADTKPEPINKARSSSPRDLSTGVYPGLIMANGARAEGIEANLFFTFFSACKASVDLFGLEKNDFIPQVNDIITVGEFYEIAAGGQVIFT
jgi:peroxiredoxin family protein